MHTYPLFKCLVALAPTTLIEDTENMQYYLFQKLKLKNLDNLQHFSEDNREIEAFD